MPPGHRLQRQLRGTSLPSNHGRKAGPAGYVEPLHLAASIIGSKDGPEDVAEVRGRYVAELSALRDMAERNLALADGFVEFVYALQPLMAFEDIPIWQNHLESLADGELGLECPNCNDDPYLGLTGPEFTTIVAFGDGPTPVTPILQEGAEAQHLRQMRHALAAFLDEAGDDSRREAVRTALGEER